MRVIEAWEDFCYRKVAEGQEWVIKAEKEDIDEWLIP